MDDLPVRTAAEAEETGIDTFTQAHLRRYKTVERLTRVAKHEIRHVSWQVVADQSPWALFVLVCIPRLIVAAAPCSTDAYFRFSTKGPLPNGPGSVLR
jgi:hypothetical protein